ncbi:MAG: hypothetical protein SFV21_09190 [Rhodospirillaceae bacterium]|nr:hypothetical protein [Rhodospirillaceae bacterium]
MLTTEQNELLNFLTETAQDAVMRARDARGAAAQALIAEAEELMTLRGKLTRRLWQDASTQLELPLAA